MEIRQLYQKDERPQDYALRVLKLLANVGFSEILKEYYSSFMQNKQNANERIILLEHNDNCSAIKLSKCNKIFTISQLCGDYWGMADYPMPFAIIERDLENNSVFDLYDSFSQFFLYCFRTLLRFVCVSNEQYCELLGNFKPDHFSAEDYAKIVEMAKKTARNEGDKAE